MSNKSSFFWGKVTVSSKIVDIFLKKVTILPKKVPIFSEKVTVFCQIVPIFGQIVPILASKSSCYDLKSYGFTFTHFDPSHTYNYGTKGTKNIINHKNHTIHYFFIHGCFLHEATVCLNFPLVF